MAQKIYVLEQWRTTDTYHMLKEQHNKPLGSTLIKKYAEALKKVGGKVVIDCNAQSAQGGFDVLEFPEMDAYITFNEHLGEFKLSRFVDRQLTIGTERTALTDKMKE